MGTYVLKRLLGVIPVMLVVGVMVFMLLHIGPVDPAVLIGGEYASPEQIAHLRNLLGLDQSLPSQFIHWGYSILSGDFGNSVYSGVKVTTLIRERVGPTFALAICTIIFACITAVPLGIFAAWRAGAVIDRAIMALTVVAFSTPVFLVGFALTVTFSVHWRLLAVQGYEPLSAGIGPFLSHLLLPVITLGCVYVALIARITRASMTEVLTQDFIRTARAKGLRAGTILFVHALKNASIPIVTTVGAGVALLIGGAVITETIFGIPGLGRLTVDAIVRRDYPVIQGLMLIFAAVYVILNLIIDLSYTLLDPRIRY